MHALPLRVRVSTGCIGRTRRVRPFCAASSTPYKNGNRSAGNVVKGSVTKATPRLDAEKVLQRLFEVTTPVARETYKSFYSSQLGGIVTDPALMLVHYDDELVQSGYAIEEHGRLMNGYVYNMERMVERIIDSVSSVGMDWSLPSVALMRIILDTCAASKLMDGHIRIWVTGGRGEGPSLYVLIHNNEPAVELTQGLSAITSSVPAHPIAQYPMITSPNEVLCSFEASAKDSDVGVFVDEEGHIMYSPGASVGIVTKELVLVTPPSDAVMPTLSMERLLQLAVECEEEEMDIVSSEQRPIHISEIEDALEVFITSTPLGVIPLVAWDGQPIGDGTPGTNTLAMSSLLRWEYENYKSPLHTEVPYGYLTGMRQQLQ